MDNRLYILGTTVGSLSIGVGLGKRSRFVLQSPPIIDTTETEDDEAPVDKRHSDDKRGTSSMGKNRINPAGSRVSDVSAEEQAQFYDYTNLYSESREEFEEDSSETGDPEEDEDESDHDSGPQPVYEVFDDAETWSKHPDGCQPITLTLYAEEDLCMDANGMFVDPEKLQDLIGPEAYDKVLDEHSPGEDAIFYIRNRPEKLDIQLIVSGESYYETRYGKERKGKKGGKFRDSEY